MANFKKTTAINGKFKELQVNEDGTFYEPDSGEIVDVGLIIRKIYGDQVFSIAISNKVDLDLD